LRPASAAFLLGLLFDPEDGGDVFPGTTGVAAVFQTLLIKFQHYTAIGRLLCIKDKEFYFSIVLRSFFTEFQQRYFLHNWELTDYMESG
jgi:hypothetical protein